MSEKNVKLGPETLRETPKYELLHDDVFTDNVSNIERPPAYRIRALRDIPEHGVRAR